MSRLIDPTPDVDTSTDIYAAPRVVESVEDCHFYHTMEIPGYGLQQGEWDLRGNEDVYLGKVGLAGKRVLEMGTASGDLCFHMERAGAEVVAFDLSDAQEWDLVPFASHDLNEEMRKRKEHMVRINNSYWLAHRVFGSSARVVYGTVYDIPAAIGEFDICTFGSILLHLRDPFLALKKAADRVRDTIIVTDVMIPLTAEEKKVFSEDTRLIRFIPDAANNGPLDAWWELSPALVVNFLKILGFSDTKLSYHRQKYIHGEIDLFTVVANR